MENKEYKYIVTFKQSKEGFKVEITKNNNNNDDERNKEFFFGISLPYL